MRQKIDWTTFPFSRLTFTTKDTTATAADLVTYTVPSDGLYMLVASVSFRRNGGTDTVANLDVVMNSVIVGTGSTVTPSSNTRQNATAFGIRVMSAGQIIKVTTVSGAGLVNTDNAFSSIYVVRLA